MLKDGSFQLVREYKVDGDRVSYYSLDQHQWEEIPTSLVDWDATKKLADQQSAKDAALVNKVESREKEQRAQMLDVDASIEAAPGIFLPSGVGLYAFDGKTITLVSQAEIKSSVNKKKAMEKILVPVPIVANRNDVTIAGPHAKLRLKTGQPEFYFRPADGREPNIDLIRAKAHSGDRLVESVDEWMGETAEKRDAVSLQRWQMAPGLYRFTLGQSLAPGEYVIAESVGEQHISLYVWDFAVDTAPKP